MKYSKHLNWDRALTSFKKSIKDVGITNFPFYCLLYLFMVLISFSIKLAHYESVKNVDDVHQSCHWLCFLLTFSMYSFPMKEKLSVCNDSHPHHVSTNRKDRQKKSRKLAKKTSHVTRTPKKHLFPLHKQDWQAFLQLKQTINLTFFFLKISDPKVKISWWPRVTWQIFSLAK